MFVTIKNNLWFVPLLLFLGGCVSVSRLHNGKLIPSVQAISIQNQASHEGAWEASDLTINYTYIHDGDTFEISGQVALGDHYQAIHKRLIYLHGYLLFLDADSRVQETANLFNKFNEGADEIYHFGRIFTVPAGTVGISFSYDGLVDDADGRNGPNNHMFFYQFPKQLS